MGVSAGGPNSLLNAGDTRARSGDRESLARRREGGFRCSTSLNHYSFRTLRRSCEVRDAYTQRIAKPVAIVAPLTRSAVEQLQTGDQDDRQVRDCEEDRRRGHGRRVPGARPDSQAELCPEGAPAG